MSGMPLHSTLPWLPTITPTTTELVASFHECKHSSPWPSWRPRAGAAGGTVRKIRGTPRPRGGANAHDPCMLCWRTPEMFEPHIHTFSPHISRGYADQKNSQPVNNFDGRASDGTTPAARFFRRTFPDLFETVLAQIEALPQPRRRKHQVALSH
jgi:hypothetical protein